jgi:hypothetical protein
MNTSTRHGSHQATEVLAPARNSREQADQSAPETGDNPEDPYSPGLQPLAGLFGALIGILSVTVPLVAVMAGRPYSPGSATLHGSPSPAGIPSARAGESGGGDSGGLPQ